jgi:glyoxylase-like metal-dependent hydrolase (beta-lactamase superfamily II)
MADEVLPGVWWLHGTRGCNVYLARVTDDAYVIVDAGFRSSAQAIVAQAEALCAPGSVTHVLLTHAHPDHTGAAGELASRLGATLAAGRADCIEDAAGNVWLSQRDRDRWTPVRKLIRRVFGRRGGARPIAVGLPIDGELQLAPGLRALPVPGHTPGTYCYVVEQAEVVFTGDLFISHSDGLARTLPGTNADDAEYLETLRRFAARAPDSACPGHGYPVLGGFAGQLRELAANPRQPLALANLPQRARRMMAFARFVLRERRP